VRIWPLKTVDEEYTDLGTEGFSGSLQDRQFAYLRGEGYTNSLADMLAAFDPEAGGTTAPTISDVSVSEVTETGAAWSVTTNEAGGTVYVRVRPSGDSAWNATQIQAAPSDTANPAVSG
jgi:hypothetical protein